MQVLASPADPLVTAAPHPLLTSMSYPAGPLVLAAPPPPPYRYELPCQPLVLAAHPPIQVCATLPTLGTSRTSPHIDV
jgi:hypothetical protein